MNHWMNQIITHESVDEFNNFMRNHKMSQVNRYEITG